MPEVIDKRALKDSSLRALAKPQREARKVVWDALMPNLAVRVGRRGRPTFYVVRRMPGARQPTWRRIGMWPTMTLAEAREAARSAIKALDAGRDPREIAAAERRDREKARAAAERHLFRNVAEQFIRDYCPTIRSAGTYERRIRDKMVPVLGDVALPEIRRGDVVELLQKIARDSGRGAAVGSRSVLSQLFNWALALDIPGFDANPAAAVKPRALFGKKSEPRARLLSAAEVAAVWRAAEAMARPFSALYRVLLLTGARRDEIARARWEDFDAAEATLLIPAARTKTARDYLIPLSATAARLIAEMPRWSGSYIFTTTRGRVPVGNFGQAKGRLDAGIAASGAEVEPFVVHDFRRVVRSALSRLGVAEEVAELCLGHVQGGIVKTYNRYSFLRERRAALELWESDLLSTVAPEPGAPDNVVAMAQARA